MGRKPKTKQYFGPPQEQAVRTFLTATTWDEKNTVYNAFLNRYMNIVVDLHSTNVPINCYPVIVMDMWVFGVQHHPLLYSF